jgi:uncharacterized protein YutE (UPF0331/DUF86 family)
MREQFEQRFQQLIDSGETLTTNIRIVTKRGARGPYTIEVPWIASENLASCNQWANSCLNLIKVVASTENIFYQQCLSLIEKENDQAAGFYVTTARKILGLLKATHDEYTQGLLTDPEFLFSAENFDEFLDHAEVFHKQNKKIEAAVLASVVFEDTLKKIAKKNNVPDGKTADPLIDDLCRAGIFTQPKAKRLKSYATTRNFALHANWDKLELQEIGELVRGSRDLIASFLG